MQINWEDVKQFFFKAMLNGWISNAEATNSTPDSMPGCKLFSFKSGDLYLTDIFTQTPESIKSAGSTTIYFKDIPIWIMQYNGWYEERVIPFLKIALLHAYQCNNFHGGRGPRELRTLEFQYKNINTDKSVFCDFCGFEEIHDLEAKKLAGEHHYWGMSLV